MSRHQKAGWYTPVDPDTRCNCGECYGCRKGQAQAKVDSVAAWVKRVGDRLADCQYELLEAQEAHAAALERLAEVQP